MFWDDLNRWYETEVLQFRTIPFVQDVFSGKLTLEGYRTFLLQYYHFVGTAPRIYSSAAAKIGPEYQQVREWFSKSAFKEMDHDEFIIRDLSALGVPMEEARTSRPTPEMEALVAYNFYFVDHRNPVGLLGTPFLMGKLSSAYSLVAAEKLKNALGLQEEGATFFFAHGHLDKDQPEDVSGIIQAIIDPKIQQDIFLNAKTIFMLYQNFFKTLIT
jgi:pyrroloquinoline quinone (PQQ) biosynthesis protein C